MSKKRPGASPLENSKKERFCRLYAGEYWGDPQAALRAAGFIFDQNRSAAEFAEELFDDEAVRERITYLRSVRASASKADETWIRELLVDIAQHAAKDSDRIRALTGLAKVLAGEKMPRRRADTALADIIQPMLPSFEGCADGSEEYSDET